MKRRYKVFDVGFFFFFFAMWRFSCGTGQPESVIAMTDLSSASCSRCLSAGCSPLCDKLNYAGEIFRQVACNACKELDDHLWKQKGPKTVEWFSEWKSNKWTRVFKEKFKFRAFLIGFNLSLNSPGQQIHETMAVLSFKTSVSHPCYASLKPLVYFLTHSNIFPRLASVYSQFRSIFVSKGLWCLDVCSVATLLLMWQCLLVTPNCRGGGLNNVWTNPGCTPLTCSSLRLADDGGQTVPGAAAGRQEAGAAGSGIDDADSDLRCLGSKETLCSKKCTA